MTFALFALAAGVASWLAGVTLALLNHRRQVDERAVIDALLSGEWRHDWEIERATGRSPARVLAALRRLAQNGIVEQAGNPALWRRNVEGDGR